MREQLTLDLEPGLLERHGCLLEVMTQAIYERGLERMAQKLFTPKGNLSRMLNPDDERKFGVDDLERYIEATGDTTPILWLCARYLGDRSVDTAAQAKRIEHLLGELAQATATLKGARK